MPNDYEKDEFDYSIFDEENATLFRKPPKKKKSKKVVYVEIPTEDSILNGDDFIDRIDSSLVIDETSGLPYEEDEEEYDDEEEEEKDVYDQIDEDDEDDSY